MSREFFWGCKLSKDEKEYIWDPEVSAEDLDEGFENHALILKQAMIGSEDSSADGDVNIVEIETEGYMSSEHKHPILRMKSGSTDYVQLDVYLPRSCILRLISGSGPVHITGQHIIEYNNDEDEGSDISDGHIDDQLDEEDGMLSQDDEELGEEEEEEEKDLTPEPEPVPEKGKRKLQNGKSKPKKMVKLDVMMKQQVEVEDEEVEEEEESEPEVSPPKRRKSAPRGKAKNEQPPKKNKK